MTIIWIPKLPLEFKQIVLESQNKVIQIKYIMKNQKNFKINLKVQKISLKWVMQCLFHFKIKNLSLTILIAPKKLKFNWIKKKCYKETRRKKKLDRVDQQLQENFNLQLELKIVVLIIKKEMEIYLAKLLAIKYFQEIKSLRKRNLISIKTILLNPLIWSHKVIMQTKISIYK